MLGVILLGTEGTTIFGILLLLKGNFHYQDTLLKKFLSELKKQSEKHQGLQGDPLHRPFNDRELKLPTH